MAPAVVCCVNFVSNGHGSKKSNFSEARVILHNSTIEGPICLYSSVAENDRANISCLLFPND